MIKNIFYFLLIIIIFALAPISFLLFFIIVNKKNNKKDLTLDKLDKYFEKIKGKIKETTKLDFFDWANLSLFILGIWFLLILIYWFKFEISGGDLVSVVVLWFTGIVVMQYTKEAYWLKQIEQKNYNLQKENLAPFVIIHFEKPHDFILKNVGNGVARNISWSVRVESGIEETIASSQMKCLQKTIIESGGGNTRISSSEYSSLEPSSLNSYLVIIKYEDINGERYITKLKSETNGDDFNVIEHGLDKK